MKFAKAGLALLVGMGFAGSAFAEDAAPAKTEKAVFGAGCFWCVEAIYEQQPGVLDVVSGYAGGDKANPTYEEVGRGNTGHAEVIEITFDPAKTTYEKLVDYFWKTHDPTNPNGVAPDFGPQYRSIIVALSPEQKEAAEKSKEKFEQESGKKVATEISTKGPFYKAEEYHQDFAKRHLKHLYIQNVTKERLNDLGLELPKAQ